MIWDDSDSYTTFIVSAQDLCNQLAGHAVGARAARALLRADVLSLYARWASQIGRRFEAGPAASSASGGGGGGGGGGGDGDGDDGDGDGAAGTDAESSEPSARSSRQNEDVEAVLWMVRVLQFMWDQAVEHGAHPADGVAELVAALRRSHLLEHLAAALLRLAGAGAAAPLEPPAPEGRSSCCLSESAYDMLELLNTFLAEVHMPGQASSSEGDGSTGGSSAGGSVSVSASGGSGGSGAGGSGSGSDASGNNSGATGGAGDRGHTGVQHTNGAVPGVVAGPAMTCFVLWALLCARLALLTSAGSVADGVDGGPIPRPPRAQSVATDAAAHSAEPRPPAAAQHPAPGGAGPHKRAHTMGRVPQGLVRPLRPNLETFTALEEAQASATAAVTAAAWVLVTVAGLPRTHAAAAAHSPQQSPQPQRQPQPEARLALRICDGIVACHAGLFSAAPSLGLLSALDKALKHVLQLLAELPPRLVAARLPQLWRALVKQLDWCAPQSAEAAASALKLLRPIRQHQQELEPPPQQQQQPQAGPAGCYSLRCALDAGLLPAMELLLRDPAFLTGPDVSTAFVAGADHVLLHTGVWPAVLAHGLLAEVAGLVATLANVARAASGLKGPRQEAEGLGPAVTALLAGLLDQMCVLGMGGEAMQGQPQPQPAHEQMPAALATGGSTGGGCDPHSPGSLAAAGGTPPAGSAAAAQQALLASFALHTWLPLLVEDAARTVSRWRAQGGPGGPLPGGPGGADGAAGQLQGVVRVVRLATTALAHTAARWGQDRMAMAPICRVLPAYGGMWRMAAVLALPVDTGRELDPGLEAALLDLVAVALAADPFSAMNVVSWFVPLPAEGQAQQPQQSQQSEQGTHVNLRRVLRPAAERHGCAALLAYLDTVAAAEEAAAKAVEGSPGVHRLAFDEAASLHRALLQDPSWQRRRDGMAYLLLPAEIEARLRDEGLVVLCFGGSLQAEIKHGTRLGGDADRNVRLLLAVMAGAAMLCGNPRCSGLDGPSALIRPGGGKTCARCKAVRYCCSACQLQHWLEGGHSQMCARIKATWESLEHMGMGMGMA
ncbi:hypothetical protein HXX76_012429 [Chlamydomonas incerta]|uniref:phytol kinase n=1 Tax=Chlamydomonas incerta TaxID=51695 RepID=A0A835VWB1_CHLIN|nr:hypothetical protein HXX76_012429 [Chlamydomonas incerta]|eukprot:KAG2427496.1 hypothetical protein HXX76_012429 [Chlamydomonas incerta]